MKSSTVILKIVYNCITWPATPCFIEKSFGSKCPLRRKQIVFLLSIQIVATDSLLVKTCGMRRSHLTSSLKENFSKRRTGTSQWTPIAPTNCKDSNHSRLISQTLRRVKVLRQRNWGYTLRKWWASLIATFEQRRAWSITWRVNLDFFQVF